MLQRLKRKRGGQPGNTNRLVHGNRSKRVKAERMAARQAEWEEQRKKFEAWAGPIEARGRLQHARILAELEAERAERALTEPELWGPV